MWRIGNGGVVDFWKDAWVPNVGPLMHHVSAGISMDISTPINSYIAQSGVWNFSLFERCIPPHIVNRIRAMTPPHSSKPPICMAWSCTNDRDFTLASAYDAICGRQIHPHRMLFIAVWGWKGPKCIHLLLWKVSHEVLMTNETRFKRNMSSSALCPFCSHHEETHLHILRDCGQVRDAWYRLLGSNASNFFNQQVWQDWLYVNLINEELVHGVKWNLIFGIMIDKLWGKRNDFIFNGITWSISELLLRSRLMVDAVCKSMETYNCLRIMADTCEKPLQVRWIRPKMSEVALNCDGSVTQAGNVAVYGGVVRDADGNFIFGYACQLGSCSILAAVLWGILHGLQIARSRGFRSIRIFLTRRWLWV